MFPVSVSTASGSKFKMNKNGVLPVVLSPIQGTLPTNAGVLDGTLAERLGLKSGYRYVLNIQFLQMNKVGDKLYPQYSYSIVSCLGQDFDKLVAEKLAASMDFNFNFGRTSTSVSPATSTTEVGEPVTEMVATEIPEAA